MRALAALLLFPAFAVPSTAAEIPGNLPGVITYHVQVKGRAFGCKSLDGWRSLAEGVDAVRGKKGGSEAVQALRNALVRLGECGNVDAGQKAAMLAWHPDQLPGFAQLLLDDGRLLWISGISLQFIDPEVAAAPIAMRK